MKKINIDIDRLIATEGVQIITNVIVAKRIVTNRFTKDQYDIKTFKKSMRMYKSKFKQLYDDRDKHEKHSDEWEKANEIIVETMDFLERKYKESK